MSLALAVWCGLWPSCWLCGVGYGPSAVLYCTFEFAAYARASSHTHTNTHARTHTHIHTHTHTASQGVPAYTAAHAYAAMAVSGAVRGFMQRVALNGIWDNPEVEHEVSFMKGEEGEWVMEVFRVLRVSEWMC